MQYFTDRTNRQWTLDLTVTALRRIKALTSIDLLDDRQGGILEMYSRSDMRLIDILFAIVKPQADQAAINDEQFGEAIGGPEMGAAIVALMREIIDFFLSARPPLGQAMQAVFAKTHQHEASQVEAAKRMANLPQIDEYLSRTMEAAETQFATTLGDLCTRLQGSSESTPDPSRSGN